MSQKARLTEKVQALYPEFSEEKAKQIVHFLLTLSEVYYEMEAKEKSNQKKKAA